MIIDGNNFLFRSFFTKRPQKFINNVNVTPIQQFMYMLKTSVNKFRPTEIYLTWDKKVNSTKPNFRKELVAYKEQRVMTDTISTMYDTIPYIQEFIDTLGIKTVYPVNMEADDVIRFLAINDSKSTIIVSSDNDLLQLITDEVHLHSPVKDVVITPENFAEVVKVEQKYFILYKAILGDTSDNIKGLLGHGPVKSKALAEKIALLSSNEQLKELLTIEQIEVIKRNLDVMDLSKTEKFMPDEYGAYSEQLQKQNPVFNTENLKILFEDMDMSQYTRGFGEWNKLFNPDFDNSDLLSQISM